MKEPCIEEIESKNYINRLSRLVDSIRKCESDAEKVELRLGNIRNELNDVVYKMRQERKEEKEKTL